MTDGRKGGATMKGAGYWGADRGGGVGGTHRPYVGARKPRGASPRAGRRGAHRSAPDGCRCACEGGPGAQAAGRALDGGALTRAPPYVPCSSSWCCWRWVFGSALAESAHSHNQRCLSFVMVESVRTPLCIVCMYMCMLHTRTYEYLLCYVYERTMRDRSLAASLRHPPSPANNQRSLLYKCEIMCVSIIYSWGCKMFEVVGGDCGVWCVCRVDVVGREEKCNLFMIRTQIT